MRGEQFNAMLSKQNNPNEFSVGLKDACCKEPCCCMASSLCSAFGCTACYMRKQVLENYHNGVQDFVCFQGYLGPCCCLDPATFCPGSMAGILLEGCCCNMISLSIARMHMMDSKNIRPDPMDYQIIAFANCMQLLSCICDIAACFDDSFREVAMLIDLIADLVMCSVAGCMGAQIHHEIKLDKTAGTAPKNANMTRP